jgi:hypothetical protein
MSSENCNGSNISWIHLQCDDVTFEWNSIAAWRACSNCIIYQRRTQLAWRKHRTTQWFLIQLICFWKQIKKQWFQGGLGVFVRWSFSFDVRHDQLTNHTPKLRKFCFFVNFPNMPTLDTIKIISSTEAERGRKLLFLILLFWSVLLYLKTKLFLLCKRYPQQQLFVVTTFSGPHQSRGYIRFAYHYTSEDIKFVDVEL